MTTFNKLIISTQSKYLPGIIPDFISIKFVYVCLCVCVNENESREGRVGVGRGRKEGRRCKEKGKRKKICLNLLVSRIILNIELTWA